MANPGSSRLKSTDRLPGAYLKVNTNLVRIFPDMPNQKVFVYPHLATSKFGSLIFYL